MGLVRRRKFLSMLAAVGILGLGSWLFRRWRFYQPRTVGGNSASLSIRGEYVHFPLDQVEGVAVSGEEIVISGGRLTNWGLGREFKSEPVTLSRTLSPDYRWRPVQRDWRVTEGDYRDDIRLYDFLDGGSGATFSLELPRGSSDLKFTVLQAQEGDVVVFAAGD